MSKYAIGIDFGTESARTVVVDLERVGVKAAPRDPVAMADAINWLIEHPDERRQMAERARAISETRYNWTMQSQGLLDLYVELTDARTPAIP